MATESESGEPGPAWMQHLGLGLLAVVLVAVLVYVPLVGSLLEAALFGTD